MTVVAALITVAGVYFAPYFKVNSAAVEFAERELDFPSEKDKKHVKREGIEKAIQEIANQQPPEMKFAVVCGRIMVGKSESIAAALKGRKGVVKVKLDREGVTSIDTIVLGIRISVILLYIKPLEQIKITNIWSYVVLLQYIFI